MGDDRPMGGAGLELTVRQMRPRDVSSVARLHAESWRTAYRGMLSDEYLDSRADAERLGLWIQRLTAPAPAACGLIAERDGVPVGFAYLIAAGGDDGATLLDNLHVSPSARGGGIGPRLLDQAARELLDRGWDRRLQLWVYAANAGARRFYERLGARLTASDTADAADGGRMAAVSYGWDDARTLIRRTAISG